MSVSRPGLLYSADSDRRLVRTTGFDVGAFTRTAFGDHRDQIDAEAFAAHPLDADCLRAVSYLWDAERSATDTLRRILATSTAREARFTAFLTTWAFDKHWFAAQLERVLSLHGAAADQPLPTGDSRYDRRDHRIDQIARIADPVWTTLVGEPVAALHAVRGLASVDAELAAYSRLDERADHRGLTAVIDELAARKRVHRDFFDAEARMRLVDTRARLLTRSLLTTGFHPLRPGGLPAAENHWFQRFVFAGGARHRVVAASDDGVRELPGMGDRGPLEAALRRERSVA